MAQRKRQPAREALNKGGDMKYDDEKEYGEDGKEADGGGYRLVKGQLTKMSKSEELSEDDLQKSLAQLEAFADSVDETSRQDHLMAKSMDSGLDADEKAELMALLGGQGDTPASLSDEVTKSFDDNPTLQKAMEVSNFLTQQHGELTKALGVVADHVEASDNRQHSFNLLLSKAMAQTGRLVQSLEESIQVMAGQPARGPKSKGHQPAAPAAPLAKSFAGTGAGDQLSKSDMMAGLEGLYEEVLDKSGSGKLNGVDLLVEISKFEQSSMMDPRVANVVQKRLAAQRTH